MTAVCSVPVVTLDGLSGAGKGTVGLLLAHRLSWHFLDSGIFYRLLALTAEKQGIMLSDEKKLAQLAQSVQPMFNIKKTDYTLYPTVNVTWNRQDITYALRSEACSLSASKVAAYPSVRLALLEAQRAYKNPPGLVADGRDMGRVIFPEAMCKFFLTADIEVRAQRRYLQLKKQGNYASLNALKVAILQRDENDQIRSVAALKAAPDAYRIDTTYLSVEQVMSVIVKKLSEMKVSI